MSEFLHIPTRPVEIDGNIPISELLDRMGGASFQGRNLSLARDVWKRMLSGHTTIFMGLAGALVPAGMRKLLVHIIQNRWTDCLVSTGANLFHDIHETLGNHHWRGSHQADDRQLKEAGIDRIYDTFAVEQEFRETDEYIADFTATLDQDRPYSTREFLNLLGRSLCTDLGSPSAKQSNGTQTGILSSAFEAGVPVYCPAIGDSSIGIAVAWGRYKGDNNLNFDIVADVLETAKIVIHSQSTGVIYLGGGTPKNFIQQTEVTASIMGENVSGHRYALQVIADPPHWGGLSGCTFAEAQSWGKIAVDASAVTVYCDVTIALPIIAAALQEDKEKHKYNRSVPQFSMGRDLGIEIQSDSRFSGRRVRSNQIRGETKDEVMLMGELWEECLSCDGIPCCNLDIAHPLFVTDEEMEHILSSHTNEAESFNKVLPCPFLREDSLCRIHETKPVDCRLFPFDVIKIDGELCWIIWELNCLVIQDESRFEEYLRDLEERLIPGFSPYLDAYSSFRIDELFSKYNHKVLRKVHLKGTSGN